MKITDIVPQKRQKERFNIFVDKKFAFGIAGELLVFQNIHIGDEIDQARIDKLIIDDLGSKAYNWALKYIGYKPRTKKEVENNISEKFKKMKLDPEEEAQVPKIITEILGKLENLDIISDKDFAQLYIEDRKKIKPTGAFRIKRELSQKGINEQIITEEIEKNLTEEDELVLAQKIVEKKAPYYKGLSDQEKGKKLTEHLLRRGFGWKIIKEVQKNVQDD